MKYAKVYKHFSDQYKVVHYFVKNKRFEKNFRLLSEAQDFANETNVNFFKDNKDKLPKGIHLEVDKKRFRFRVCADSYKFKIIKSSKNLEEVMECRTYAIKSLLDLHQS